MNAKEAIEALKVEAQAQAEKASQLEALISLYPDLKRHVGRWGKEVFHTKAVNTLVTDCDIRHNCGCCSDSPLEVWPYLETPHGRVYSDPPSFSPGERCQLVGDRSYPGWENAFRVAGIPEGVIAKVQAYFNAFEVSYESSEDVYEAEDD